MTKKQKVNVARRLPSNGTDSESSTRKIVVEDAWNTVLRQLDAQAEGPEPGTAGFAEFELDFELALSRQLGPFFEKLSPLALNPDNIERVVKPRARGAYYLILNKEIVYIGKSDAKAGLRTRLLRHYKTLKRRRGINWADMEFKAVKVSSLAALDTESLLLDLYRRKAKVLGVAERPEWNFSGFGSNDTGVERDTQRVSVFDQQYPLDLAARIDFEDLPAEKAGMSLDEYLTWLSTQFKFVFRRQTKGFPTDKSLGKVVVDFDGMTRSNSLSDLLLTLHAQLPYGWALTILRGKVVLYFDDQRRYKSPIWRLEAGSPPGQIDYKLGDVGAPNSDVDDEVGATAA